jgi:spermidine synthase
MYSRRSFLRESGYVESVARRMPCRRDGTPLPWMNYGIIDLLEERLDRELDLFEYGSGNSTVFYANRVREVVSVEEDPGWYQYIRNRVPANARIHLVSPYDTQTYSEFIARFDKEFDVVVVDGNDRSACLTVATKHLSPRGVIILDDTQDGEYESATNKLQEGGYKRLDVKGLKPGGIRSYTTSVFYREENCLGL